MKSMFLFRLTLFINISVLSAKVLPVFSCRVTWNYGPFKEILRKKTDKPITVRTWSQNLVFRPRMNIYVKWVFFLVIILWKWKEIVLVLTLILGRLNKQCRIFSLERWFKGFWSWALFPALHIWKSDSAKY